MPQITWSISSEAMFYLAFPLMCVGILAIRSTRANLAAAIATSVVALGVGATVSLNTISIQEFAVLKFGSGTGGVQDTFLFLLTYFSPYLRMFEFLLGCLCASVYMNLKG